MRKLLMLGVASVLAACGQDSPPPSPAATARTTQASAASSAASSAPASELTAAINLDSYTRFLREISDDRMEGRGPGTAGETRTLEYLTTELKQIGLKPGNGDSYLQPVAMVEITGEVTQPLTFKSAAGEVKLTYGTDFVASSRHLEPEISVADAPLVYAGFGVVAPEYNWNDYAGLDVKGKIVVVLINDPGFASGDESMFKGKAMTYYGRWTYKFEEAARQGAAGVLIVHDDAGASYGWDVVKNSWGGTEYDLPIDPALTPPVRVQGWISGSAAEQLFAQSGLNMAEQRKAADVPGFKPVELKSTASIALSNKVRKADSQNVIGVVRGTERPDEWLIYTAHWDHLGRSFGLPDGIFNGAIDNGTGIAGLLEIARSTMAGTPPKRSIAFLFVTLEESGLLGSRFYTQQPIYPLKDTVAVINMDAMHVIGPTRDMTVIGYGNSELEDIFKASLAAQQRVMKPESTPENGFYFRSDHFNFAKAGVPALYPKTGIDHVEKGEEHGLAIIKAYNTADYHKPTDEFDPSWDLSGAVLDLEVIKSVGSEIANGDTWPNWYEGSEFKAKRDAMRAPAP